VIDLTTAKHVIVPVVIQLLFTAQPAKVSLEFSEQHIQLNAQLFALCVFVVDHLETGIKFVGSFDLIARILSIKSWLKWLHALSVELFDPFGRIPIAFEYVL
jgi:hypothetical protein